MAVKISSKLPGADRSGLDRLQGVLVKQPSRRHLVIAVIDCASTRVDHDGDGDFYTPTAGVQYIEPVLDGDDLSTVLEILGRARAVRIDDATLDFDFGVENDPFRAAAQSMRDAGVTSVDFGSRRD